MQTIAERLEHALKESGMTASELARAIRIRPQAVSQWISGTTKSPSATNLLRAAKVMGVDPDWLIEGKTRRVAATARVVEPLALSGPVPIGLYHAEDPLADGEVEIPAVNVRVGAGNRIHTEQVQEERRFRYSLDWIQRYGLKPEKLVRYRVRGTSMDPFISDGSWITVEMGYTQVNDGGTYLLRYGDQISVKFLFRRYDGGLILRSFNPSEPDVVVPAQDLEHVDVLGRVVESTNMLIKPIK